MSTSRPQAPVVEILAALGRAALRRGDLALARVRLMECLAATQAIATHFSAATPIQSAAELAYAIDDLDRAAEFYGASERILRRARRNVAGHPPSEAVDRLRDEMGADRFRAAWVTSHATPFPTEFYLAETLRWLEGLTLPARNKAEHGDAAQRDTSHDGERGSTLALIERVKFGSTSAAEDLAGRHLPQLQRFAHGRLPDKARGMVDTSDLVQETMVRGLAKLEVIKERRKGSFLGYLKRILINQVLDEIRRASRRPKSISLDELIPSNAPTPLEDVVEWEALHSFQNAVHRLPRRQREALVLRVMEGRTYQEIADAIGSPSANAARMLVSRTLTVVAKALGKL